MQALNLLKKFEGISGVDLYLHDKYQKVLFNFAKYVNTTCYNECLILGLLNRVLYLFLIQNPFIMRKFIFWIITLLLLPLTFKTLNKLPWLSFWDLMFVSIIFFQIWSNKSVINTDYVTLLLRVDNILNFNENLFLRIDKIIIFTRNIFYE